MGALPLLLAVLAAPCDLGDVADTELVRAVKAARDRVFPTLVHIEPITDAMRAGRTIETLSTGSGVIISSDGLVVTNYHVAGTAKRVTCTLSDRRRCPAAVVDSTWYPYAEPLARSLPGPLVEVRCRVPVEVARERYVRRVRDPRHLDGLRDEVELWGEEVAPLGLGPLLEVDTSGEVDVGALAAAVRSVLG